MEDFLSKPKAENIEDIKTEVIFLSAEDLVERIYQGKSLPQDSRFLPFDEGGVFRYFYLRNIISSFNKNKIIYSAIEVDNLIVGLSELEQDPNDENNFWIKFISIDPKYQGKRLSSKLIEEIFKFAKENNYSLQPSFYSEQGLEKIKKVIDRNAEQTGVRIIYE